MKVNSKYTLYRSLISLIREGDIDFVGGAISIWHAAGLDAFAYDLSERTGKRIKGVVIIEPHPQNGIVLRAEDFACREFADVEFLVIEYGKNYVSFFKRLICLAGMILRTFVGAIYSIGCKGGREIYLISTITPKNYFFECFVDKKLRDVCTPVFVQIDEGLATYMSHRVWNVLGKVEHKNDSVFFGATGFRIMRFLYKKFVSVIMKGITCENRFLFSDKDVVLTENKLVAASYKKVFFLRGSKLNIMKSDVSVLVLTQAFSEYGQIREDKMLGLVEKVIKCCYKAGLRVAIKTHPREDSGKYVRLSAGYNVEIIDNKVAAEDLFQDSGVKCVIGFTSTALLSAKVVFDIFSVSLIDLVSKETDDEYLLLTRVYLKSTAQKILYFVKDFDELRLVLEDRLNVPMRRSDEDGGNV